MNEDTMRAIREALVYLLERRAVLFFDDNGLPRNQADADTARRLIYWLRQAIPIP